MMPEFIGDDFVFYDKFVQLCVQKGVTPSRAAIEAGLSKSTVTKWKNNEDAEPSGTVIKKLSQYFNISYAEVLDNDEPEKSTPANMVYNSQEIADRIKLMAKQKQKPLGEVLSACELGKNTVSKISKGTDILTLNFAKIADYLDCSIDYLLGRTTDTIAKPTPVNENELDEDDKNLLQYVKKLTPAQKKFLIAQIQLMLEQQQE